ncbi:transposable element Tcb2 transposase [Trichonephila clavipes]|nr:transposable element Tcb2 transposase [Trichonephila clavipes]
MTPSTDQSSRRPPHRKKCTRSANCFIDRHPGTGTTCTRGPCVFSSPEWNQVVFSDEPRFNLSNYDNRVRVWRPRGERINPAFALQRHTAPTAGVMVWGVIAYNTRSSLVLIRGTMIAQRYAHDILQPHVLPLMQRLPGAIPQQGQCSVSQDCLCAVTTLPWPARLPDLSPIEHIWDHLGRRVGHPTSLKELEARLQQIWNVCLNARSHHIVHSR